MLITVECCILIFAKIYVYNDNNTAIRVKQFWVLNPISSAY